MSNSNKLSNVDGNTFNDLELESQDPFIDYLCNVPTNHGISNVLEPQRPLNSYDLQLNTAMQIGVLNSNSFAVGGHTYTPNNFVSTNMTQEGSMHNLNPNYIDSQPNLNQLQG